MNTFFADAVIVAGGSGSGLIHSIFILLVIGVAAAVLWWFGRWVIGLWTNPPLPGPVRKIWDALFVTVAVVIFLNWILGLTGHSFISY